VGSSGTGGDDEEDGGTNRYVAVAPNTVEDPIKKARRLIGFDSFAEGFCWWKDSESGKGV
jgi:hypothetical protein